MATTIIIHSIIQTLLAGGFRRLDRKKYREDGLIRRGLTISTLSLGSVTLIKVEPTLLVANMVVYYLDWPSKRRPPLVTTTSFTRIWFRINNA